MEVWQDFFFAKYCNIRQEELNSNTPSLVKCDNMTIFLYTTMDATFVIISINEQPVCCDVGNVNVCLTLFLVVT